MLRYAIDIYFIDAAMPLMMPARYADADAARY